MSDGYLPAPVNIDQYNQYQNSGHGCQRAVKYRLCTYPVTEPRYLGSFLRLFIYSETFCVTLVPRSLETSF